MKRQIPGLKRQGFTFNFKTELSKIQGFARSEAFFIPHKLNLINKLITSINLINPLIALFKHHQISVFLVLFSS